MGTLPPLPEVPSPYRPDDLPTIQTATGWLDAASQMHADLVGGAFDPTDQRYAEILAEVIDQLNTMGCRYIAALGIADMFRRHGGPPPGGVALRPEHNQALADLNAITPAPDHTAPPSTQEQPVEPTKDAGSTPAPVLVTPDDVAELLDQLPAYGSDLVRVHIIRSLCHTIHAYQQIAQRCLAGWEPHLIGTPFWTNAYGTTQPATPGEAATIRHLIKLARHNHRSQAR